MTSPELSRESHPPSVPKSPFSTILNFRDVGYTINHLSQAQSLRTGLIFRSARPDDASASDYDTLQTQYNVKTIIHLRSKTELQEQAKRLQLNASKEGAAPAELHGIDRVHVDLNGGPFARALMSQLGWLSFLKLIFLYASGWRLEAIKILGTEVMRPRGLTGLAHDSLDHSQIAIRTVFEVLGNRSAYPILVHCTQGKDRTGLIMILSLLLLDVPVNVIDQDYRASVGELIPEEHTRLKEIRAMGLGDSFAGCPEGFVESVCEHLATTSGGTYEYLRQCGISIECLGNIKHAMSA